ncbi:hypothetical protein [Azospirillum sp. TSO22-1]|uniref:hypothetical protein n=1 Tax=Azospirillum sp. TSO22-1 TaxID=716789 RepID=UPI000D60B73C|nr:hypothetical protein [Azospirillum sp. TSO22-1]PWC44958.1 hypothetical protein TSO221_16565 [Azospirillum sp. TSO22-1]
MFVCALACATAHPHVHWMMRIEYGARFDFDGWMVIDTAVVNGELVGEAVRRGLSFGEAAQLAEFLNRHGKGLHANQN